jgi:hypothetical protein
MSALTALGLINIHEGQGSKLIDYLCNLSDVILFSAAVPHQGGEGHVNEQRQSYWMKKFYKNGFFAYDIVRKNVWNDKLVNVIYKQNMFLYVSEKLKDINENLTQLGIKDDDFIDIIHPDLYELRMSNTIQKDHGLSFFGKIKRKFFA